MSETPTTTQQNVRVQTHKYDKCAVCDKPMQKVIETVVGGSVENNSETTQAKTCYEPVDGGIGKPARTRLFFHSEADLEAPDRDGEVKLDQAVTDD